LLLFVGPCLMSPAFAEQPSCAMLLMHGKWGHPNNLAQFGKQMEAVCDVKGIEMPWSRRRMYDQPYLVAIEEIGSQVKALRDQGYKNILLVGHSFGSNAALAYMAVRGDVDGIVALAPGHSPELTYRRGIGRAQVEQARQWVAEGRGAEWIDMEDFNQGRSRTVRMRADVLWSYFDPAGLGHMPLSASKFLKPVPLLWVIGTGDPLYGGGAGFAFNKAPVHPASKYLVVEADHMTTPEAAVAPTLDWVRSLPLNAVP
jgi:pimeloyl-ACP methyl ester carboxylesterase